MAFYLSPGVYTKEIDLTTTVPAVSSNVSVNVIREPGKGMEFEKLFISNDDQLVDKLGKPTEKSYKDILSCLGFLKYGSMLYCSVVRPEDATFAGKKIESGYDSNLDDYSEYYTFNASGSVDSDEDDGPYDYIGLGGTDLNEFPTLVEDSQQQTDDVLGFISTGRNENSNRIRVLVADRDLYNAIKYHDEYDEDTEEHSFDAPSNITLTEDAKTAAGEMYIDNPSAFYSIRDTDISFSSDYQLMVVVHAKDQGSSNGEEKESFLVSTDETERDDSGNNMFIEHVINEGSNYIRVALNSKYKTDSEVDNGPVIVGTKEFAEFSGGKNGYWGRHSDEEYQTSLDSAVVEAYDLYSNAEEIDVNLFIDSDKSVEVKRHLIDLCEVKRKDCMCILDVPREKVLNNKGSEAQDLVRWRKGQDGSTFNPNSSYAAVYGNWIEVLDKGNKKYRGIPASGYVTGLFANTDNVADPWFAAAGLNRAILTGVRRLAGNPDLGERDLLYKNGLNPVVSFSGQGKVVGGQKTLLDKSSAFNRVNVRRLFLVLEKAISKASKYFLFEINDEVTWMLMTNMIEPFLRDVKGRRGIYAFKVQIDETTNTPERIDRNELWGNIFIQPARSAEFIVLNFIATPTGANFDELIGAV